MPASSKAQQRFFGVVKSMQKGDKPKTGKAGKIAKRMSKKDVDKYASTKHKGKPEKVKKEQRVRELIKKMVREELDEAKAKRDYKAEYKKFQSSTKSKKYRAELNAYNRKKGTYGNGDGKDASHKGGKIVGFESQSKNRGRREKSRLKKEGKLNERLHVVDERYVGKYIIWVLQDGNKIRTAVLGKKGFDNFSSNDPDDLKKLWNLTKKFKGKPIPDIATEGTCGYGENGELGEEPAGPHLIKKKKIKESRVAKTILQQLGGNKFIAMTGAKNFGSSRNSLQFKIGRNSKSISHVIITLKSSDLYDVEFIRMRGTSRKVVKKLKGVYGDMLPQIFKKYTGMNVRL